MRHVLRLLVVSLLLCGCEQWVARDDLVPPPETPEIPVAWTPFSADEESSAKEPLGEDELEAIREEIRNDKVRVTQSAEAFAKQWGKRAVPVLLEMLKTESNPTAKRKCCVYLGMIGDTRAVKPIIDYLQSELPAEFTRKDRGEILNAMYGLAFLDSDEARAFIELLMTDEYWLGRKDLPVKGKWRLDSYENRKSIRHHCVMFYAMNLWFCQGKEITAPEHLEKVPADILEDWSMPPLLRFVKDTKRRFKKVQESDNDTSPPSPTGD